MLGLSGKSSNAFQLRRLSRSRCGAARGTKKICSPDDIGGLQAAVLRTPMLCIGYVQSAPDEGSVSADTNPRLE